MVLKLLANGLIKNTPDCPVLCNWVFDNFILPDEPFVKVWRSFKTCVLVNSNLCGKLFSSLDRQKHLMKISKLLQYLFYSRS